MALKSSHLIIHHRSGASGAVAALVIIVIVVVGGIYAYNSGYLPIGPTNGLPTVCSTVIPANDIINAYVSNAANADQKYKGKTLCISGTVAGVEQDQSGNYVSCSNAAGTVGGCTLLEYGALEGYITWNWANQSEAARVSGGTPLIAKCQVAGFNSSPGIAMTLELNDCVITTDLLAPVQGQGGGR